MALHLEVQESMKRPFEERVDTTFRCMADLVITAGSVIAGSSAKKRTGVAGEAMTAGELLYVDAADGNKLKLTDANPATAHVVAGIALHAAASGQPITYAMEDDDLTIGATVAIGDVLIASPAAGKIAPVADKATGDYVTVVGVAKSAGKVNFKPIPAGAAIAGA